MFLRSKTHLQKIYDLFHQNNQKTQQNKQKI